MAVASQQNSGDSDTESVETNTPSQDNVPTWENKSGEEGNDPSVGSGNNPAGDSGSDPSVDSGSDQAGENQNGSQPANGNRNGDEKKDRSGSKNGGKDGDDKETGAPSLFVGYLIVDRNVVWVDAQILNAQKAEGTWEILLDGKAGNVEVMDDGLYALAEFEVDNPGTHQAVVRFQGKVDGKDVNLEAEKTVQFPDKNFHFEITYDGKRTFGGKLSGVKQAEGIWYIGILNKDGQPVAEHVSDRTTSLSYSHAFKNLKPGTYIVWVAFEGVADGEELVVMDIMEVTIKDEGSGGVKDPGKDKPPVIADPDKGKKVIENAKGGKLPDTATPYPNFAFLGGLMLLIGFVLLKFRKVKG